MKCPGAGDGEQQTTAGRLMVWYFLVVQNDTGYSVHSSRCCSGPSDLTGMLHAARCTAVSLVGVLLGCPGAGLPDGAGWVPTGSRGPVVLMVLIVIRTVQCVILRKCLRVLHRDWDVDG